MTSRDCKLCGVEFTVSYKNRTLCSNPPCKKEARLERVRKYKRKSKDKIHQYYLDNKDKIKDKVNQWAKHNPNKVKANKLKHQEKKKLQRQSRIKICKYCECEFNPNKEHHQYCESCSKNNIHKIRWVRDNMDKVRLNQKIQNSTESSKEGKRRYRLTSQGKLSYNHNTRKRRARLKGMIHDFNKEEWRNKVDNTKGICPDCGKDVGVDKLTLDHIIPISKCGVGTVYTIDDVRPVCKVCNSIKGSKIINFPLVLYESKNLAMVSS